MTNVSLPVAAINFVVRPIVISAVPTFYLTEADVTRLLNIRASGGGSRSPLWRQIQADVFGQKVVTLNAEEGAAYGVALLAAVGGDAYRDVREACRATIHVVKETSPNRLVQKHYNHAFPVYQQLYQSLKADFQRIAELEKWDRPPAG